jgi:predicted nucleic acid-binding protein
MNILIDSSIWIDFLRNPPGGNSDFAESLRSGRAVACPVVWVEICSGIKGKREELVFRQAMELCPSLEMDAEVWRMAAAIGRMAKKAGLNCPLADVLIAACAKRHGADLMHRDKHLAALMKLEP